MIAINVLVVDALPYGRKLICSIVKNAGFRVAATASDGQEAYKIYNELKPDLVLMDMTLPKLNGIKALKRILEINPQAKIILFSDISQESLIKTAYKEGAKDFIIKPFTAERVVAAIKKVLEID